MKYKNIKLEKKNINSFRNLWNTLISARALFNRLPEKSTEMKRLAINACISKNYADTAIFWTDFKKMTKRLLRNVEFLKECETCRRNPVHVAEHVVFLGSSFVEVVGDEGLGVLQGQELLYVDPICTEAEIIKLHEQDTYEKYVHDFEREYNSAVQ